MTPQQLIDNAATFSKRLYPDDEAGRMRYEIELLQRYMREQHAHFDQQVRQLSLDLMVSEGKAIGLYDEAFGVSVEGATTVDPKEQR